MFDHPFTNSALSKTAGVFLILTAMLVQWGLLVLYVHVPCWPALTDSMLSVGLLSIAGYAGWYFILQVRVWQAQAGAALLVQILCLTVTYTVLAIAGMMDTKTFLDSLPLRFLFGLLCWIILIQWYKQLISKEAEDSVEADVPISSSSEEEELIDRISVKDGSRIHIIPISELFCIQASGDYVTLFTSDGQYVKEQTMKYFESHLPSSSFVRIHRSSIVNTNYILRVELFGKDSYQVRLKNGTSLRASHSGYKLLKERLNL